ncbi:uncharacterized protein TrAtP1_010203 [Trichoderma atroviride]|uniref:uncharacterized protein n=1 Tax=Hypocrea atroviridis TaxID=63577 RepID=UPI00332CD26C|nr:hypothetical protein TrAtP1_010203 [Trichoderma atroviride]
MDSLIFRALMGLSFPQDSREEVQSESSVIKIQIDPVGSSEDMICVESLEQSQRGIDRIVGRFVPKNKFKSPPEIVENSATGFRAATRQWRDANPRPWCILEGYHIFDSGLSKSTIVSKAFRYMKKELAEISGQSDLLWRRTVRRLQLESDHDGVLRALIVCETYSAKSVATKIRNNSLLLAPTKRFLTEFRQLGEIYRPRRTSRNLEQIFQLQLHHANLNLFSDFLQSFATDYAAPRMFMFDSREVELRRWNLKAIMTDSHLYRQFSSLGAELTTTTESLLDIVLALEDSARQDVTELTVLGAEIRGCSKDIMTRLSRLSDDLDHNLQLLRLSKDMNQSGNVQMLTLLATIFLPLSLSAGVLSMQSRFKDLGDLLYDFFGVVVLLGAGGCTFGNGYAFIFLDERTGEQTLQVPLVQGHTTSCNLANDIWHHVHTGRPRAGIFSGGHVQGRGTWSKDSGLRNRRGDWRIGGDSIWNSFGVLVS